MSDPWSSIGLHSEVIPHEHGAETVDQWRVEIKKLRSSHVPIYTCKSISYGDHQSHSAGVVYSLTSRRPKNAAKWSDIQKRWFRLCSADQCNTHVPYTRRKFEKTKLTFSNFSKELYHHLQRGDREFYRGTHSQIWFTFHCRCLAKNSVRSRQSGLGATNHDDSAEEEARRKCTCSIALDFDHDCWCLPHKYFNVKLFVENCYEYCTNRAAPINSSINNCKLALSCASFLLIVPLVRASCL